MSRIPLVNIGVKQAAISSALTCNRTVFVGLLLFIASGCSDGGLERSPELRRLDAAIAAAEEPAEIIGTATSRAQLQRIAWRAERRGDIPDYEKHIDGDIARDTRRYDHLVTITGWADAAGVDVSAVNGYLDEAAGQ